MSGSVAFDHWLVTSTLSGACTGTSYTFLGFTAPLPKTKLSASNSTIPAKFRLGDSSGNPLSTSVASGLVTRLTLSGPTNTPPGTVVSTTEPCPYNATSGVFKCNLMKPRTVTIGAQYWITACVKVGPSTYVIPVPFGGAVNPEPVTFKK